MTLSEAFLVVVVGIGVWVSLLYGVWRTNRNNQDWGAYLYIFGALVVIAVAALAARQGSPQPPAPASLLGQAASD